jgi:hypothetical protein
VLSGESWGRRAIFTPSPNQQAIRHLFLGRRGSDRQPPAVGQTQKPDLSDPTFVGRQFRIVEGT